MSARTGSVPQLTLTMLNTADEPWIGTDAMDTRAYLLDNNGERLPLPSIWTWDPVADRQRVIAPGHSITLTPSLMTLAVEQLPAGRYGLKAVLRDLELESNLGTLQLV
jgi:hypothetical protein